MMPTFRYTLPFLATLLFFTPAFAQEQAHLDLDSPFASFVEDNFPFFSQTLDARAFGETPELENLTPRGIIVKAGHGFWGCFDPDLLRWSLFWKENEAGEYLTMDGMGTGSYRLPNRKSAAGQGELPKPLGVPLLASPPLPGWSLANDTDASDPRIRGKAEVGEIGLGPLPAELGRFSGIRLSGTEMQIEYTIAGTAIRERLSADKNALFRDLEIAPHTQVLQLHTGEVRLSLEPSTTARNIRIALSDSGVIQIKEGAPFGAAEAVQRRWKNPITTGRDTPAPLPATASLVYDDLPLPVPNPWKRNVRLSGFDFFPDGRAAFCTFDGDVWITSDLSHDGGVTWSRFASGLHDPQSLCLIDGTIQIFDRNGIVRLHDTDGNGEADWHENFSNVVAQTAETREFPMDMIAAKDGSFYLAKGGQIGTTFGKVNGTIVQVSPDGLSYEIISTGLRQPYLGYDPETGILTASDQQGNWKPATPIYRIEPGRYFGFQPEKYKGNVTHPASINPPEVWIPHFINQSGAGQVWLKGPAKMGELNGSLIHIGYNRPEIFKIYLGEDGQQGAIFPLLSGFPSGVLKGRVHPHDGLLYLCGFEIWGTSGSRISGLFRVKPGTTPSWIPREIKAEKRGVLLAFNHALSPELATDITRYSVDRWNYRQTHEYGSGNFRLDGEAGQESVPVSSAKLSRDGKSLFIGLREMAPSHTLRVTYRLPIPDSVQVESAYLTVLSLPEMKLTTLGFENDAVDLTQRAEMAEVATPKPTAELGREVAMRYGCIACHATGDSSMPAPPAAVANAANAANAAQVAVGPPWLGLWNASRTFTDGSVAKAEETYLRESILDPPRRVAVGFETERTGVGMPSYLGVLKDHEIESIILYIKSLKKK